MRLLEMAGVWCRCSASIKTGPTFKSSPEIRATWSEARAEGPWMMIFPVAVTGHPRSRFTGMSPPTTALKAYVHFSLKP